MTNYVTFKTRAIDITPGKLYLVNQRGEFFDDVGDERELVDHHSKVATEGAVEYIIRCVTAPNVSCQGNYICSLPDYVTGHVSCTAEHKAAAQRFTLEQVAEFLRFTHKQYHEHKRSSEFEVLLAPIRVVGEPEPRVGNSGYKVGDVVRCILSGRRELIPRQLYRVVEIDGDGDEKIEPVYPEQHTESQLDRFPSLGLAADFTRGSTFTAITR